MPLVFGMTSSHTPNLYSQTFRGWQWLWNVMSANTPQPPEAFDEGPEVVASFVSRTAIAFARLRDELLASAPDVLIVVGGDQTEWFDGTHLPSLLIYAGSESISGFHNGGAFDEDPPHLPWERDERYRVTLRVDQPLAEHLLDALVMRGFDVGVSRRPPTHDEARRAAPHSMIRPVPGLLGNLNIPIVPIMMKTVERSAARLSGTRCLALGRALAEICSRLPQRIAIYGTGGMSHDPTGPLSGWVDEPLDRWFLRNLSAGTPEELSALFSFRSAATESGTGELRTWMTVAGAMDAIAPGNAATIVDYFAARTSTCGNGWVYWP